MRATFRLSSPALIGAVGMHVVDRGGIDTRALDCRLDRDGGQVVGANVRERSAVATDGRPDGGENDGSGHADDAS